MDNVQGLFIAGTDTGVGKSLVTCAIVRILREGGIDAVGFKPMATGASAGSWGDANALFEASGKVEPIEKICPLRFAAPLAPTLAARREGIEPDVGIARGTFTGLCARHAVVIVEGIGGVLVPLDRRTLLLDFAAQVGFPVLVVCRAALGTINHTALTVRETERAGLKVMGIIMNTTRPEDAPMVDGAKEEIERITGRKVIAVLPFAGGGAAGSSAALRGTSTDADPATAHAAAVSRAMVSLSQQITVRGLLGREGGVPGANRSGSRPAV